MAVITLREMLNTGVHFGHQTSRWNPKMQRFILTERNGIYIIDLQQSLSFIDRAYEFVKETVAHGGTIAFVGTKRQAQSSIVEQATRVGMPYVDHRWLGGMLTNFATVSKRVERMKELEEIDFDDVAGSGRTKKELLLLKRELTKLRANLGGIRNMTRTPSAVWIVDTEREHLAVKEANKLGIPIVAILDTNADPDEVSYPIPGNDDEILSVELLTRVIADAVADGLIARNQGKGETGAAEEPMTEWERELLAPGKMQVPTSSTHHESYQEVLDIIEAVLKQYRQGVIVEVEREDDGSEYEVEVVSTGILYELEVTTSGEIALGETEDDDEEIGRSQRVSVSLAAAVQQARGLHPTAVFESIELEEKNGELFWEVELKNKRGSDIEFDLPAMSNP